MMTAVPAETADAVTTKDVVENAAVVQSNSDPTTSPTAAATDKVGPAASANDIGADTTTISSTTITTTTTPEGKKNVWAWIRTWRIPSLPSMPSLPILKILQCIFFLLMIGQNVPGPHKKAWPFNDSADASSSSATVTPPLTPYYVEMRSDLYGHERQFPSKAEEQDENDGGGGLLWHLLMGSKAKPPLELPQNTGIPNQQHIVLKLVNREYESYRYSVQAYTTSKTVAATEFRNVSFRRALDKVLARLVDPRDRQRLTLLEERFLDEAGDLVDQLLHLRLALVDTNNTMGIRQCHDGTNHSNTSASDLLPFDDPLPSGEPQCAENDTLPMSSQLNISDPLANSNRTVPTIESINKMLSTRVASFLKEITDSLPPGPGNAIKDTLLGHAYPTGVSTLVQDLRQTPMRLHFAPRPKQRLFVTHFVGDMFATAVSSLRQEVTAIVRSATSGVDEVLVVLQSGGGTVTGYGLVAAQLLRLKEAGLRLTVAVEQAAASGGYMVACVGDTIVCSPFAVVGSIGVVQEMPNFYERLKREGVEFHEITAGDYKRVLSPTKEATPKDLKKAKEDIEDVWKLFKDFVAEQRPSLDINVVATGEVWFGKRALEVGLCDSIRVSDDVLTDFVDRGYDVYSVKYEEPVEELFEKFWKFGKASAWKGNPVGLLFGRFLHKTVSFLVDLGTGSNYEATLERWNTILMA